MPDPRSAPVLPRRFRARPNSVRSRPASRLGYTARLLLARCHTASFAPASLGSRAAHAFAPHRQFASACARVPTPAARSAHARCFAPAPACSCMLHQPCGCLHRVSTPASACTHAPRCLRLPPAQCRRSAPGLARAAASVPARCCSRACAVAWIRLWARTLAPRATPHQRLPPASARLAPAPHLAPTEPSPLLHRLAPARACPRCSPLRPRPASSPGPLAHCPCACAYRGPRALHQRRPLLGPPALATPCTTGPWGKKPQGATA
jgi:hypothetical protein